LIRKINKAPSDNHSQPRRILRWNKKEVQLKGQGNWFDIWLPRISHFSQFGLFVVTLGSLYFVVLPLYQKAVLDEAIARKEIELKESEKLIAKSYEKLRSYAVKQFVHMAGINCTMLFRDFDSLEQLKGGASNKEGTILNLDVSNCLNEEVKASKDLKELHINDQVFFSTEVKNIAVKIEQNRIIALERYRELPNKAKLNPSLLKPPKSFTSRYLKSFEELNNKMHFTSQAYLDEKRFKAGVQSAQFDVVAEYGDFARTQLLGLRSLTWSNSK